MTRAAKVRRAIAKATWSVGNPIFLRLAGVLPWWAVLETTGRRTGLPRQIPLARGPVDGNMAWLIAVHGHSSAFAKNIATSPEVRLRLGGRWHRGTAALQPLDPAIVRRFNRYARLGPTTFGINPALLRVELRDL